VVYKVEVYCPRPKGLASRFYTVPASSSLHAMNNPA
jgi:hypothetical protein